MTTDINPRIAAALTELLDLYPKATHDEASVLAYARRLNDLPDHLVVQAIEECARTSTFYPSLAEIRNRVTQIAGESILVDPESAWGEVLREVKRVGAEGQRTMWRDGKSVTVAERQFSSPLIGRAADAVGWKDICLTDISDLPTLRAQFRDALRAIQRREVDRVVSGRGSSPVRAIENGNGTEVRDGFKSIAEVVTIREPEKN